MIKCKRLQRHHSVDIAGHHAQCELNFHQLLALLPGLREGKDSWSFNAGVDASQIKVSISILEKAPYTTTIAVEQDLKMMKTPRIVVRLYHDVGMAEIVSWDHHRHWKPHYPYPNAQMYHPDEKLALNQFLGDWLNFCLKLGLKPADNVIKFT